MATITFQNLFRLYKKLSGMTGTADTEAEPSSTRPTSSTSSCIPTNKPMIRDDHEDLVYKTEREKFTARHRARSSSATRRGSRSSSARRASRRAPRSRSMLKKKRVPHAVLNAKQHETRGRTSSPRRAAKARSPSRTNMAGRGTDIVLGGNPEMHRAARVQASRTRTATPSPEAFDESSSRSTSACRARPRATRCRGVAGGLHILGTERHESRRIDNQLRGRAGRQGDPGSSALLPVARGRPDAHLRAATASSRSWSAWACRTTSPSSTRGSTKSDRGRAAQGRGAQLRHPQEPPRIRRRDERAAQDHLRPAPADPRGALLAHVCREEDQKKGKEPPPPPRVIGRAGRVARALREHRPRVAQIVDALPRRCHRATRTAPSIPIAPTRPCRSSTAGRSIRRS